LKFYLEKEAPKNSPFCQAVLQFLGFKWDMLNPSRNVKTRYNWLPGTPVPEIDKRLRNICSPEVASIASELLKSAIEPIPDKQLHYLEVVESENLRRSFDINVYDQEIRMADISLCLIRMWNHFHISSREWQPLLKQTSVEMLGHLSGGLHRNGEDFFSMYYGRKQEMIP